eukprot:5067774-Ditylum_brightwellii.AAC.1
MSEEIRSALKIPVFDGEEEHCQSWMIRFQAYAMVKGFSTALKISSDQPATEEEIGTLDATQPKE